MLLTLVSTNLDQAFKNGTCICLPRLYKNVCMYY